MCQEKLNGSCWDSLFQCKCGKLSVDTGRRTSTLLNTLYGDILTHTSDFPHELNNALRLCNQWGQLLTPDMFYNCPALARVVQQDADPELIVPAGVRS